MHNRERVCFGVCVCGLIHVTLGWAERVCHPPNAFSGSVCIDGCRTFCSFLYSLANNNVELFND
jgi:hypothetical protein